MKDEPALYPFEIRKTIKIRKEMKGKNGTLTDLTRLFSAFGETDRPTEPFGD